MSFNSQPLHTTGSPLAEIEIDVPLVHRLLQEQHPDLADLPIQPVDSGWDNAMFRLGDRLSVRLPRRKLAATLIEHEQRWLPHVAGQLPMSVPVPHRLGKPSQGYPWCWSVLSWLPGVTADQQAPDADQAARLGAFLRSLHIPAPANAPFNPFRAVPLHQKNAAVEERFQRLEQKTRWITPEIKQIWRQGLNTSMDVATTWIHGDLHARNILVDDGVITGIIDWGDMTVGDRATDLATLWMLFADQEARQQAIATYGDISQATLQRARGWAVFFGVTLLDAGLVDNPPHAMMGERTLHRVIQAA